MIDKDTLRLGDTIRFTAKDQPHIGEIIATIYGNKGYLWVSGWLLDSTDVIEVVKRASLGLPTQRGAVIAWLDGSASTETIAIRTSGLDSWYISGMEGNYSTSYVEQVIRGSSDGTWELLREHDPKFPAEASVVLRPKVPGGMNAVLLNQQSGRIIVRRRDSKLGWFNLFTETWLDDEMVARLLDTPHWEILYRGR